MSPSFELAGFHTPRVTPPDQLQEREESEKSTLHNSLPSPTAQLAQALPPYRAGVQSSARANWSGTKWRDRQMLWTIFVILLILWLVGIVSSYTLGGFIHLLLVIALVVLLINLISGRRPVV
jgi:hypothetical protein